MLCVSLLTLMGLSTSACGVGNVANDDDFDLPVDDDFDLPVIENIGINIDYYNEATNKAGDFQFDTFIYPWSGEIYCEKVFDDYGSISTDENGTIIRDPQPIFVAPLGTKVHAITTGVVIAISTLWSGDYSIQVIKENNPKWVYEHEHVINVTVGVGDNVIAGQEIAEVSDYNEWLKNDGYGVLDIGIFTLCISMNP